MRFKLLAQHYIDDRLLEPGTEIGEGTEVPFLYPNGTQRPPSDQMEGLDDESRAAVEAVQAKAYPLFDNVPINGPDHTAETVDMTDANQTALLGIPKPVKVK